MLRQELGIAVDADAWSEKNHAIGGVFFDHALLVSDVMVGIELACRQCGIVEKVEVADLESGKSHTKTTAAHSFHDLRHNCAVLTYHAQKEIGNSEPWKIVQIKLGHKSVKVTQVVYLAHVEIFGHKQGLTDIRRLIGIQVAQGE